MLKLSSPVGPVRLPSYNFIRHSLPNKHERRSRSHGGVGLYIRKGIKATPVLKSTFNPSTPTNQRVEYLAVQARINSLSICVAVIYNPCGTNPLFPQLYENLIDELSAFNFDRLYLMGDFNINVAAEQPSSSLVALNRIHTAFNLSILPTAPTRITEHSSTTIDLLVTDTPQSIKKAKTSSANTLSDHEIVFLIADLRIPEPPPQLITVRNLRSIDQAVLHVDFQNRDFSQFYNTPNVDTKTQLLTAELKSLLDTHAPERTTIVRDRKTPWITFEIKRAIAVRDLAYSLYVRNPNRFKGDAQWVEYIRERSRVNSLISNAKKRYAERCFSNDISPKQLWSNLRREGVHNNSKRSSPDEGFDIDLLNAFFSDGHQTNRPGPTPAPDVITEPTRTTRRFSFHQITTNEVSNKLFEIQSNAIGCDNIPVSFLKLLCPFILPVMKHLFNTIISSNHFPSCWKKAIVTPIPKVTSPTSAKDFRPISVLPAISKVLEKILLSQITLHLNESDPPLLAMNQSGYRKGYSTTTALTKVVHDIVTNFDNDYCTVMVLVDFSLAFNSVKHNILNRKLKNEFGFTSPACEMISSFLSQRCQTVRCFNQESSVRILKDGTPQGSCLSALLFSLYINDLPSALECNYQLYADDLQVYVSGPKSNIDSLVRQINNDLTAIEEWSYHNHLSPNPNKTQAIVFSKSGTLIPRDRITFCNQTLPIQEKVKNLGLIMDSHLTWKNQTNDIVSKVYFTLKTFRRFQSVLSTPIRLKLVQAVIIPIFLYGDVIYFPGLSAALKDQLLRCFKSASRFIYNLKRRESTSAVRKSILGRDLLDNYHLRIGCFMRQGFCNQLPDYLTEHLQHARNSRTKCFILPHHTTSCKKSILLYGASYWNSLPISVKESSNLRSFKEALNSVL